MLLSYEKQDECFKLFTTEESIVTISQQSLAHFVSPYVANDLFEFASSVSEYEIPGHVLIIMVIICLYSRDGVLMMKQVTAASYEI